MWTPKRIVLLSACFFTFFALYLGYAWTAVGRIDGLPPLPETYWPTWGEQPDDVPPIRRNSNLQKKLQLAFGDGAQELKWPIKLDVSSRNMVLAAADFKLEGGRVLLAPLSIAVIGKEKHDGLPPEINTIRGQTAYLTFDRPVSNFSEIASRKITQAELTGRIQVVNNRRRVQRDEDLRVSIDTGTLYYEEDKQRIWTEGMVKLEDFKSKPKPHEVRGQGMEMVLQTEAPPPAKPGGPKRSDKVTITGVKWITLWSNVDMRLFVEGQSSFMVSAPEKPATKPAEKTVQKSQLHITTPGHFRFDLYKDHDLAQFDVQPAAIGGAAVTPGQAARNRQPPQIAVERTNLETKVSDHLICQHLTLRLVRKEGGKGKAKPGTPETTTEAVELQAVRAVAPKDKRVVLVSNADQLEAEGTDFYHDAVKQFTVLKGEPVVVNKQDSRLQARELRIQNVKAAPAPARPGQPLAKPHQHMTAMGPGDIHFVDKKEGKKIRAYWQDTLTSTKDGPQDLLVLVGKARFLDEQADQSLAGDTIKVWLEEVEKKQASPRPGEQNDSRRPRHLEATGHVVARSRDMNVNDASRLVVWFKDIPGVARVPAGRDLRVPATTGAPTEPYTPAPALPLPQGPQVQAELTKRAGPPRPGEIGTPATATPARPFDLTARSVEAWVLRSPEKSALDQLWCEGTVEVKQNPAKGEEKGTRAKGDTLRMTGKGEGLYELVVTGGEGDKREPRDQHDLAELETEKIYIIGPEITIDQASNKAWVIGDGAMKMDSKTNFQGEELARPVPLTVHWSNRMLFHGERAEFHGNIQAVQERARMACQGLQVYFDRPISLREGNKGEQAPQVKQLVCDREVRIEDSAFEGERLVKYQRLEAPEVQMRALEPEEIGVRPGAKSKASAGNQVFAYGSGNIRMWKPGSGDDPLGQPNQPGKRTAAKPGAGPEMRMTYVTFGKRMDANSKTNTAQFWGGAQVLDIACPRHDAPIDLDVILVNELPAGSLFIKCDHLKVLDRPEADGRPNKQMEGRGKVWIQGEDFWAQGEWVSYNQLKQQVIIKGGDSGNATLTKVKVRGAPGEKVEAKEIIHNRSTGQTSVVGASSVSGQSAPPARK